MSKTYWSVLWVFSLLFFGAANSAERSRDSAVELALEWMAGNPVMSRSAFTVASVQTFPDSGDYSVYAVELSPAGYLILNSDDRLPLVVSFSADSSLDLSDDPLNALRGMLLDYCERKAAELAGWDATGMTSPAAKMAATAEDELVGPFLETSWNQNNPYNLLCPDDPSGSQYYDYRVPVGCVPTAYAQILNFHRWPVFGTGSHSYTDSWGSITGTHSADFSDSYAWALMEDSYDPWNTDSSSSKDAVAELMVELGVACEADYESDGTSAGTHTLGSRLSDYFYYESIEYASSQSALIDPMEADLRAGFPCVVSIPGHAIVADGLMVDDGETTYHINYGWGGSNNGWYTAAGVPNGALSSGITALRPKLMAFPLTNEVSAVTGGSVELEWIMPKRRTNEVAQLDLMCLEHQQGTWSSNCSEITGDNSGWEVVAAGYSGSCWYVEESSSNYGSASLILDEIFVPDASASLTFRQCARLYIAEFTVDVSTDGGETYSELYEAYSDSEDRIYESSWSSQSVSLSDYAGQEITLRFSVSSGGYYSGDWPGVRLDSLAITSGDWYAWEPFASDEALSMRAAGEVDATLAGQPVYYSTLSNLSPGTYMLAAVLTDTNATEHALGPSFALTVTGVLDDSDGDGLPNDWELLYYGGETNANPSALASNGVNTVLQAYIAGLDPTDPYSFFTAMLTDMNGFTVRWNATSGRVYSVWSTTNLLESFQPLETNIAWPQASWTDSVPRVENFYRIDVQLAD